MTVGFPTERVVVLVDGRPYSTALPVAPIGAAPWISEAVARRRQAVNNGWCPCGATRPRIAANGLAPIRHVPDCPAHDLSLHVAAAAWKHIQEGASCGAETR